jgi:dihydropteroate synthase
VTHFQALERHKIRGRVQVMGIVNRTPDSFFDGGRLVGDEAARVHAMALMRAGADVIDVGAESTRPGSGPVSAGEQIERLGDLVAFIVAQGGKASIDTNDPEVADHALRQGASIVNSTVLTAARELAEVALRHDAELVLTHCRGSMTHMAGFSDYPQDGYGDVTADVAREWLEAAALAHATGLPRERIWFDPGLGFAKNAAQSLELCARLGELKRTLGHPVLVGPSRKSFVATAVTEDGSPPPAPSERLGGTIAAVIHCALEGADMVRVHDVAEVVQALAYFRACGAGIRQAASTVGGEECSKG